MIDLLRQLDYFNPIEVKEEVHVVGVGAVGSHVATALARLGIEDIHLWDFDNVESHNIPNQIFTYLDLEKSKSVAVKERLESINPEIKITLHGKYEKQQLKGYIFSCVDYIEVRKELYEKNEYNINIKAIFDTRIGLDEGQVYSANWQNSEDIKILMDNCDFNHDEVEQPKSACGTKLAVLPTVMISATLAISNFINFIKTNELKRNIIFNAFNFKTKAY